jgi:hypothetical protein
MEKRVTSAIEEVAERRRAAGSRTDAADLGCSKEGGEGNRAVMTSLEDRWPSLTADLRNRRRWSSGCGCP